MYDPAAFKRICEIIGTLTMKKLVYVEDSPIHGKGLFAKQNIRKGTVIGRASGYPTKRDGTYVLWLDEKTAYRVECDFRFINHSDNANAAYYDTLEICALKDIKAGEEITHNYEGSALL